MNHREISPDETIGDLVRSGVYGRLADYIFTYMTPDHWNCKLSEYGFDKVGFVQGLHRMEELAASDGKGGASYIHQVYPEEENLAQWDKKMAQYIYFPAKKGISENAAKPYALVIPGGGFNRQWGFIEGLSIAAALNTRGVPAFILYYRVKFHPVVSFAIEDMIAAIQDIDAHAQEYGVEAGNYIAGGFSAGATLADELGSTNFGWRAAGIVKPKLLFLGYTACRMDLQYEAWKNAPADSPLKKAVAAFLYRICGEDISWENLAPYQLFDYMDASYPPVYLTANEDDGTVPFINSSSLAQKCQELGVPVRTRFGKTGGHSFGLGNGLAVEGWLDDMLDFLQTLMKA